MPAVTVVHWNPRRALDVPFGRLLPVRRRLNNFGDLLGPVIVRELLRREGIAPRSGRAGARLLAVGSILMMAADGDVVWGAGFNGKSVDRRPPFTRLDVRAVRGPLTQARLLDLGLDAPAVFGDPGLLVGTLWDRETLRGSTPRRALGIVPNFHDLPAFAGIPGVIDPRRPLRRVLAEIAASDLVVGSSLHGVVVAESLGIPARVIASGTEPPFKYEDYYRGSGRDGYTPAGDLAQATALGGEPGLQWDPEALLASFPYDLWRG